MDLSDCDVGGVRTARPFVIRRLGHFGINVHDPEVSLGFYSGLLGLAVSDPLDFSPRLNDAQRLDVGPARGYFLRHGTDHHSFVIFPKRVMDTLSPHYATCPQNTSNQITWQVGSLNEVRQGFAWFQALGKKVLRAGRDIPGSNWHFYPPDPYGHINELFYGIEQVGWNGLSKPKEAHAMRYERPPEQAHISEQREMANAQKAGVDMASGWRHVEQQEERFDVDGVLLARPFKIVGVGPVRLFVDDVDRARTFYEKDLGLRFTESVSWRGHVCVFLRANTEHHSIALYPIALRDELGLRADTTLMSFGFKVATYTQLKRAVAYLESQGVTVKRLPAELSPGIDYSAFAIDPDGHAIQLYYGMEQIGWDGRPRPADLRPQALDPWPDVIASDQAYLGETYLGPFN
jgi:catechol 2,3-dioxygenase-like lactoylglutathione lyase family enzyme